MEYLAEQLRIEDPSCVKDYTRRKQTIYEHTWEIRKAYGYKVYEDHEMGRRFRTFLHGRAWIHAEGPVALFDHAVGWLRRHRVLLPGVHVLARQVSEVRTAADKRLHATVAKATRRADPALPGELIDLLEVPEGKRWSHLERLRRSPTRLSGTGMARSLERLEEIAASRGQVHQALEQVEAMIGDEEDDGGDSVMRRTLAERYNTVRPFLALLGESAALGAASGGRRVLAAVKRLPALARRKVKQKPLLPKEIDDKLVPPVWRRAVYANPDLPTGSVDRNAYVMCVLEQLTRATPTRHLRLPLPPVVRSAGQAAGRGAVAGGARGRAGWPEPGGTGREALG
ncbi:DUF4158 domain-containing protein [Nonomuraea angiospora]|uniref:DUF4158 domain-containing protein n=1 Tax=Nonomuraea angiospora TaxID=46172 RepID=UPI003415F419